METETAPHLVEPKTLTKEKPPHKLTAEEFLDWVDEDTLAEWKEGEVIMAAPASKKHQEISGFLLVIMRIFAQAHGAGSAISAPFMVKLSRSFREPDILFVAREHEDRLKPTYLDGPPDLVVEIISPESFGRDRGEKFYEYEEAGVAEYWLVDPQREVLEVYVMEKNRRYRLAFMEHEGKYESSVLSGLWVKAEWFWQDPLPPALDVLKEIGVV